ncbi:MAG: class I SAM-dependent methyltransferase [Patescibacteria group bacterium]
MFYPDLDLDLYAPGGEDFLKEAAAVAHLPKGSVVLEIGASAGFGSIYLAKEYGVKATATDINPAWLTIIKQRALSKKVNRNIATSAQDVLKLSFRKGTFDFALANGVLFLTDKAGALRQINRVLKNKGLLILGEPLWLTDSPPAGLRSILEVDGAEILTTDKYLQLFKENGFELVFKKIYPSTLWENYYTPLQEKLSEWKETNSPNLTKYSTEIDLIIEEMEKVRSAGAGNLGYGMLIGRKTAEATFDLL